ncbi:techylectin-5A [Caerostris extrusa]|uniref:Techylectin-5A n=1 Tax=Caerostris extrusa TaxID=172846 RepID=A0AAV4NVC8_CAEEX|nr:techylectin-5A [Caerostris extrusa]
MKLTQLLWRVLEYPPQKNLHYTSTTFNNFWSSQALKDRRFHSDSESWLLFDAGLNLSQILSTKESAIQTTESVLLSRGTMPLFVSEVLLQGFPTARLKRAKIEALKLTMCHFVYSILFLFLTFSQTFVNGISACDPNDISTNYLDTAMDMISNAKKHLPNCPNALLKPMDCAEVLRGGHNKSGVYTVWPRNRVAEDKPLDVYCDMDTDGGGWTVFQRRGDFLKPKDYFYKDWASYKKGFGHIDKDFWLGCQPSAFNCLVGNDNLYALSNQRLYSIRFDLRAVDEEKRYALYETFWIDDESHKYTLHIREYSGDAGDSMISQHNNMTFSTKDQDNDNQKEHCAEKYKGGWWYNSCHFSNLNGLYHRGMHESFADGVNWHHWRGYNESLDFTEMKIRPKNFRTVTVMSEIPKEF